MTITPVRRPPILFIRYAIAVLATVLAFVLTQHLGPVMTRNPFLLFIAAVIASAWYGGLGPGLLSSVLSTLGSAHFVLPPQTSFATMTLEEGARLSVFVFVALLVNTTFNLRQRAEAALQKREQEEQVIFDSVPAMIWYKDKNNRILRANKAAADSIGLRVEDIEGKSTHDFYPEDATRYYQDDIKVMKTGQPKRGIVEPYRTASGDLRWIRTDKIPYCNDNGDIIGVIVFAVDITDRIRAEEALQKTHANLERLVQERTQSLAQANAALRAQIQERLRAEEALKTAHAELEQKVVDRTAELVRSNLELTAEIRERERIVDALRESEDALRRSREQLRALAAHLESVREEERARIAREIHDELGQAMTALNMDLSWLRRRLSKASSAAPQREKVTAMAGLLADTIESVRRIVSELHPSVLDQLGLEAAIEWQAAEFQKRHGIICRLLWHTKDVVPDRQLSTSLFRILQESLTNVARHADATHVTISIEKCAGQLRLDIMDNGKGIPEGTQSDPRSFGILSMQERALALGGTLEIEGKAGHGTTVCVQVPIGEGIRP